MRMTLSMQFKELLEVVFKQDLFLNVSIERFSERHLFPTKVGLEIKASKIETEFFPHKSGGWLHSTWHDSLQFSSEKIAHMLEPKKT